MIFKYMQKTNCDHLNSEQINIIQKYDKKEKNMFVGILLAVVAEEIINLFLDKSFISVIISLLLLVGIIAAMVYYFWFKKTKYKRMEKDIVEKENT